MNEASIRPNDDPSIRSSLRPDILGSDGKPYGEQFHIRQPQHIALADTLGLGIFDKNDERFEHRRIELA